MRKMEEILSIILIENYEIFHNVPKITVHQIKYYPHIFKIEFLGQSLIAKCVRKATIHCNNINQLYRNLSGNKNIQLPLLNNYGDYSVEIDNQIVLLYNELSVIKEMPDPTWWANCLASIHSVKQTNCYHRTFSNNLFDKTLNLFSDAKKYIDKNQQKKIYVLLDKVNLNAVENTSTFTLCHNDPYNLNVMLSNNQYKLIDTEGMGLAPKEFDLQRLLYNNVVDIKSEKEIINFWHKLKVDYENISNEKIDLLLFKSIYILDFIRSLSWLYIVSNDGNRLDRERQMETLNAFSESINNDSHIRILQEIK